MADLIVPEGSPVNGVQRYVRYVDQGDGTWAVKVASTGGGGGGGDASAANQATQITAEQAILAKIIAAPATEAKQDTMITALQIIDNLPLAQASSTASQTGPLIQGAVTTAAPTYGTGTTNPLSIKTNGDARVADADLAALLAATNTQLPASMGSKTTAGSMPVVGGPLEVLATGSTVTRPANTTPYTANDAVSDNATAASVTPVTFTSADFNDMPVSLRRLRIHTTDTGFVAANFAAYIYQTDPTASSGVVGGDNAAFSTKKGTFLGRMSGTFRTFSDGAVAVLTPDEGSEITTLPTSGAKTLFALYQTLSAATPSANSTTFIGTIEGFQGRA